MSQAIPSATSDTTEQADSLLVQLGQVYAKYAEAEEFEDEKSVFMELLPKLLADLEAASFDLKAPVALGSTATVWIAFDRQLQQDRALKLPRPRLGKLKNIISIVRAERVRLAGLSHQNLTRIYYANEVKLIIGTEPYSFPYFVMDFLKGIKDLDKFILNELENDNISSLEIISYLRDVLLGVSYLHGRGIIHCDLKPGNLLIADDTPALVADLGYAKHLPRIPPNPGLMTKMTFTPEFAHPDLKDRMEQSSDPNASVSKIPRVELRVAFDLFALGRTFQRLLYEITSLESRRVGNTRDSRSIFSVYQWQYLELISKRLLDGKRERNHANRFLDDTFWGLSESIMGEIRYTSAEEALEDIEKLLSLYDLEGAIPELNPNIATYIQIPHCKVPLTPRVRALLEHPYFLRLMQVTQLGFVSLVYPGASHTRFEHILGVYTHACEYIRALWYDEANPIFRSIMSREDIELALLAALLHDIAQYPMAHDFTEVSTRFAHEPLTLAVLERQPFSVGTSLSDLVFREWGVEVKDVVAVLESGEESSLKRRLLHSIISGPLDCDKLDYVRRDSTHLGVPFGDGIDHERMVRNLTVVYGYQSKPTAQERREENEQPQSVFAHIGVTEKALAAALGVLRARQDMFRQVYWQHTVRALKAMLGFVIRDVLIQSTKSEGEGRQFWADFDTWLFGAFNVLQGDKEAPSPAMNGHEPHRGDADNGAEVVQNGSLFDPEHVAGGEAYGMSGLNPADDAVLSLLARYASPAGKQMVDRIRRRSVYRRTAVISDQYSAAKYKEIYGAIRAYRLDEEHEKIEHARAKWQRDILVALQGKVSTGSFSSDLTEQLRELTETATDSEPIILVDVPIKALNRSGSASGMPYLPEDFAEIHTRPQQYMVNQQYGIGDQESFDRAVGKIRLFVAPEWSAPLAKLMSADELVKLIRF